MKNWGENKKYSHQKYGISVTDVAKERALNQKC
jgi:hypothetical protein